MKVNNQTILSLLFLLLLYTLQVGGQTAYEQELANGLNELTYEDDAYFKYFDEYADFLSDHKSSKANVIVQSLLKESIQHQEWKYLINAVKYENRLVQYEISKEERIENLTALFQYREIDKNPTLRTIVDINVAYNLQVQYDDTISINKAKIIFEKAKASLQSTAPLDAVDAIYGLTNNYILNGQYKTALTEAQEGYELSKTLGDSTLIGRGLYILCDLNQRLGIQKKAIDNGLEALNYLKEGKDDYLLAGLYNVLYYIAVADGNLIDAMNYIQLSRKYARSIRNYKAEVSSLINIAYLLIEENKIEDAKAVCDTILPIVEEHNFTHELISYHLTSAMILEKQEKNKEALDRYVTSLKTIDSTGVDFARAWVLSKMSDLMRKENLPANWDIEETLNYFEGEQERGLYYKTNIAAALKNLYFSKGDIDKAFDFSEKHTQLQKELIEKNAETSLKEQLLESDNKAKEQEIFHQKKEIERQNIIKRLLIGIALIVTLFTITLIYFLRKLQKSALKISNQKDELLVKQTQITNILAKVNEKNELLERQVIFRQKEIIDHSIFRSKRDQDLQDLNNILDSFINKKNANISELKLLKEKHDQLVKSDRPFDFKHQIESIYINFYEKLKLKYPNLTNLDLNHCAYVLMDLSTKQIAKLNQVSLKSVESARYRAKQKMALNQETNLRAHLLSIARTESSEQTQKERNVESLRE